MVNPVLTILFYLFLIGSASAVIAAMVMERHTARLPRVGTTRTQRIAPTRRAPSNIQRLHMQRRRAA